MGLNSLSSEPLFRSNPIQSKRTIYPSTHLSSNKQAHIVPNTQNYTTRQGPQAPYSLPCQGYMGLKRSREPVFSIPSIHPPTHPSPIQQHSFQIHDPPRRARDYEPYSIFRYRVKVAYIVHSFGLAGGFYGCAIDGARSCEESGDGLNRERRLGAGG